MYESFVSYDVIVVLMNFQCTLQAAVNSRDEERDRLRKELKFAQEELNRLRRIKQKQMEAEKDKDGGETEEKPELERPISMVSETSTVSESEGDDNKDDSELTDEHETGNNFVFAKTLYKMLKL